MESYVFDARLTDIIPIGLVPDGLRIDVMFEGTVSDGPMTGSPLTGVDYLLFRSDGVGVIDAREMIRLPSGAAVAITARGFAIPEYDMPPLEAMLDPSFQFPDAISNLHGCTTLQTMDPSLAAVNSTMFAFTGTVNPGRGDIHIHAKSVAALVPA